MALARCAVQYVRPDVCLVGGISGARKIAALAEAHHVGVVPHNPLSPVSTAACLQIAATAPKLRAPGIPHRGRYASKVRHGLSNSRTRRQRIPHRSPTNPASALELKPDAVPKMSANPTRSRNPPPRRRLRHRPMITNKTFLPLSPDERGASKASGVCPGRAVPILAHLSNPSHPSSKTKKSPIGL